MLSYSFAAFAGTEEASQHCQKEESSSSSVIIESSRDFFEAPDTQVGFWGEGGGLSVPFSTFHSSLLFFPQHHNKEDLASSSSHRRAASAAAALLQSSYADGE